MKSAMFVAVIALVMSAITMGVVLLEEEASSTHEGGPAPLIPASTDVEILTRLEALRDVDRMLLERLARLEERPLPALEKTAGDPANTEARSGVDERLEVLAKELEALRATVESWSRPEGIPLPPEQLEGQVAEALESIQRDKEYAQALAGFEKRTASLEPRVQSWSNWLRLDEYQRIRLTEIMTERDVQERDFLKAWESGQDRESVDQMRKDSEREFFRSVRSLLSPDQAESFSEKFGDDEQDR